MPENKQNRTVVKRNKKLTSNSFGQGKNYLLSIGINQYKNYNPLFNAVEDAKAVSKVLKERYGFEDIITLYDENATRDNILAKLENLENLVTPKDNLLIFYAGHGFYHKKTGYLVPQNAPAGTRSGLIANSTLIENLKTIDAHHILLILDPVSHLFTEIRKITTYNAKQTPLGGPIPNMNNMGGEFIFHLKNASTNEIPLNSQEEKAWQLAENQPSISGYLKYIMTFPDGKYITKAYEHIAFIEKQLATPSSLIKEDNKTPNPLPDEVDNKRKLEVIKSISSNWKRLYPNTGTFTDSRDGQTYKTVKLKDGKTWMAQNFNYDVGEGCWQYDDDPSKGKKYGRLYNWEAAKKACPVGWRLPDWETDWYDMVDFYGGFLNFHDPKSYLYCNGEVAFEKLMNDPEIGFLALFGGFRNCLDQYRDAGLTGAYWSNTTSGDHVWSCHFEKDAGNLSQVEALPCLAYSCRYVKVT